MASIGTSLAQAVSTIESGGLIAYPTEAVYGLGCAAADRTAAERLLSLKNRPIHKGLISIVSDLDQVRSWLDEQYAHYWSKASQSWPAAITWLFPSNATAPSWLTGKHQRLAVRMPSHPLALALCKHSRQALISTSANIAGEPACKTSKQVYEVFSDQLDYILEGNCGEQESPSIIKDLITDERMR